MTYNYGDLIAIISTVRCTDNNEHCFQQELLISSISCQNGTHTTLRVTTCFIIRSVFQCSQSVKVISVPNKRVDLNFFFLKAKLMKVLSHKIMFY